ncbi:MAG: sulfite exporter TauE/SafE family protein [Opitutaceae bacterium]|nr:sulfite exporter TauE/SafE family protein [Opitutaceae bacterium]
MIQLEPWQWLLAVIAAALIGVAKTGVAGLGMLSVVLFAQIMPAKQATGIVLPLLCFGDIVATLMYRQHARWKYLWRLFPWTAAGVFAGYFALGRFSETQARILIAAIVLTLVGLHLLRRHVGGHEAEHGPWFPPTVGVLAGFTTLVANAAGPLMTIYLLAMRLPKMDFVGTAAVFFLLLNLFKVPFMIDLGLINGASFTLNLLLAPAVLAGTWLGGKLLLRINQRVFENLALGLAALAGLKLVVG